MPTYSMPQAEEIAEIVSPYITNYSTTNIGISVGYAVGSDYATQQFGSITDQFTNSVTGQNFPIALNEQTPFEVASITKTFTSTLYAYLLNENYFTGSDLSSYIGVTPLLPINSTLGVIPIFNLLSYQSGLPTDDVPNNLFPPYLPQPYNFNTMWRYLARTPPSVDQSFQFTYSNMAFALAAAVMGGGGHLQTYCDTLTSKIFRPLGMSARFFDVGPMDDFPLGFNCTYSSPPTTQAPYPSATFDATSPGWDLFPAYYGAGGLIMSSEDLMIWLRYNMGLLSSSGLNSLLPTTQKYVSGTSEYGGGNCLGWFIDGVGTSDAILWKNGWLDGTNTSIQFQQRSDTSNPNSTSDYGVFAMLNVQGMEGPGDYDLADFITNEMISLITGTTSKANTRKTGYASMRRRAQTVLKP